MALRGCIKPRWGSIKGRGEWEGAKIEVKRLASSSSDSDIKSLYSKGKKVGGGKVGKKREVQRGEGTKKVQSKEDQVPGERGNGKKRIPTKKTL